MTKHIQSRDNPLYKRFLRLAAGKRELQDSLEDTRGPATLLEGVHLCESWLQQRGQPDVMLYDADEARPELLSLLKGVEPTRRASCDARLLHALSQVPHGPAVFFLVRPGAVARPSRISESCLWLDRIQDPGNVGTLLRTAAAAGLRHAYLSAGCAAAWSPKVLRSGQGAHFALTIHEQVDLLNERSRLDVPLVATALSDASSLYRTRLPDQCVWLMGNEGQGVDPALLLRADKRVFIPQEPGVESLNVAAAAAVCLFEHRRQRLETGAESGRGASR